MGLLAKKSKIKKGLKKFIIYVNYKADNKERLINEKAFIICYFGYFPYHSV